VDLRSGAGEALQPAGRKGAPHEMSAKNMPTTPRKSQDFDTILK